MYINAATLFKAMYVMIIKNNSNTLRVFVNSPKNIASEGKKITPAKHANIPLTCPAASILMITGNTSVKAIIIPDSQENMICRNRPFGITVMFLIMSN